MTTVSSRLEGVRSFALGVMKDGPMQVIVRGQPHPAAESDIEHWVLSTLRGAMSWTATPRLTVVAAEAASPSFRLLALFNASGPSPCHDQPVGGPPIPGGRVELTLAFCSGDQALAVVRGSIRRSDSISDPRLARLLRQATHDLFEERHHS